MGVQVGHLRDRRSDQGLTDKAGGSGRAAASENRQLQCTCPSPAGASRPTSRSAVLRAGSACEPWRTGPLCQPPSARTTRQPLKARPIPVQGINQKKVSRKLS